MNTSSRSAAKRSTRQSLEAHVGPAGLEQFESAPPLEFEPRRQAVRLIYASDDTACRWEMAHGEWKSYPSLEFKAAPLNEPDLPPFALIAPNLRITFDPVMPGVIKNMSVGTHGGDVELLTDESKAVLDGLFGPGTGESMVDPENRSNSYNKLQYAAQVSAGAIYRAEGIPEENLVQPLLLDLEVDPEAAHELWKETLVATLLRLQEHNREGEIEQYSGLEGLLGYVATHPADLRAVRSNIFEVAATANWGNAAEVRQAAKRFEATLQRRGYDRLPPDDQLVPEDLGGLRILYNRIHRGDYEGAEAKRHTGNQPDDPIQQWLRSRNWQPLAAWHGRKLNGAGFKANFDPISPGVVQGIYLDFGFRHMLAQSALAQGYDPEEDRNHPEFQREVERFSYTEDLLDIPHGSIQTIWENPEADPQIPIGRIEPQLLRQLYHKAWTNFEIWSPVRVGRAANSSDLYVENVVDRDTHPVVSFIKHLTKLERNHPEQFLGVVAAIREYVRRDRNTGEWNEKIALVFGAWLQERFPETDGDALVNSAGQEPERIRAFKEAAAGLLDDEDEYKSGYVLDECPELRQHVERFSKQAFRKTQRG